MSNVEGVSKTDSQAKSAGLSMENIPMPMMEIEEEASINQGLLRIGHQVVEAQKTESFFTAWRNHWKGASWSFFISMALWMEGFDNSMLGSFYGQPAFRERFGSVQPDGKMLIPNKTQVGLTNTAIAGQLIGLVLTGVFQEWKGAKMTFFGGMILMILTIFVAVFAQNLQMLFAAEFLMGVPWGMFQTLTTAYAAEICPINMRGYLAAWAQMAWAGGKFICTGVLRGTLSMDGSWAWRLPYALQWMWPVPLAALIFLAPESPWWLARKGRYEEAKAVIRRCTSRGVYGAEEVDGYIEFMKHTDLLDRSEKAKGNFFDMFKGTNLRRTEVQLGAWITQIWCGSAITVLSVLFFEKAGLSTSLAFNFTLISNGISILGVAASWVLLRFVGRRNIYNGGLLSIISLNLIIGIMGFTLPSSATAGLYAIATLMVLISFVFSCSLGPICYTIAGELPASRLRAQSIVFGRFVYVVMAIVTSSINPYVTNNWGPKSALFWMGTGSICFLWCFFRLPETGGFSFADLDILFANKISARKFTSMNLEEQRALHDAAHPGKKEKDLGEENDKEELAQTEIKA